MSDKLSNRNGKWKMKRNRDKQAEEMKKFHAADEKHGESTLARSTLKYSMTQYLALQCVDNEVHSTRRHSRQLGRETAWMVP